MPETPEQPPEPPPQPEAADAPPPPPKPPAEPAAEAPQAPAAQTPSEAPVDDPATEDDAPAAQVPATQDNDPLVKLNLGNRMGGGAIDAVIPFVLGGFIIMFHIIPVLGMIIGLFGGFIMGGWALFRDTGGGIYAPGKMVTKMVVIDIDSGELASMQQCLIRNSYYGFTAFFAVIPCVWLLAMPTLTFLTVVDAVMIAATPNNQRIGDYLAGTRVVPASGVPGLDED